MSARCMSRSTLFRYCRTLGAQVRILIHQTGCANHHLFGLTTSFHHFRKDYDNHNNPFRIIPILSCFQTRLSTRMTGSAYILPFLDKFLILMIKDQVDDKSSTYGLPRTFAESPHIISRHSQLSECLRDLNFTAFLPIYSVIRKLPR